jgi:DNA polymerase-2
MSSAPLLRGFVLQPTYRIESGRPVVQLYGRLENGRSFLVRDDRQVPCFFVEAADAPRARELGARPLTVTGQVTLEGRPVVRVEVPTPSDAPPLRDRLIRAGIACHEADVRFAMRYLIDRGIRGSLALRGDGRDVPGLGLVFDNPEVVPADWTPALSVLSFDIETDPRAERLLSIGLHGSGASEVLLLTPPGTSCPEGAVPFATEKDLLQGFCRRVRELDPDILTGWNVLEFDLAVLARLAARRGTALELGRGPGALRLRAEGSARGTRQASVPGRVVLDGIFLLRGAFVRMHDYSLDAVAREVLGEGKTLHGHGRADEILRLFEQDRPRLVEYNRTDARLAKDILDELHLVELAVERSRLTGMPLDRVSSSIAAFDFLYLSELRRRGVVAPSVRTVAEVEPMGGGHVLEPLPGLYRNVLVLDFKSLYPSLIRTFQIDPSTLIRSGAAPTETDPIVAPSGAAFARRRGILTEMLDAILPQREAARRAGDRVKSQAIKILMNSFYGVLGTPACRFYDPRLANAITSFGREVLLWCKRRIEASGRRVLYGDTDSLFVEARTAEQPAEQHSPPPTWGGLGWGVDEQRAPDADDLRRFGETLAAELTRDLADHIARTWRVESRLELQFERLYLRLYLPAIRHGTTGARKRYAGLVEGAGGSRVVFTGMEAVRGDWTPLAKEVQRELFARLFSDRPVDDYLRRVVADLRAGRLDDRLVYRKGLRKDPAAYLATTPPHVAAARKLIGKTRGRIAYVMTTAGPEPLRERQSPIDHEHYVDKQVRPVAEPVLALLGLDFAQVVGDDRQLSLF